MNIIIDENVCFKLADVLKNKGHQVFTIAANKGISDKDVWDIACNRDAILITRDYHFTNPLRYNPCECLGLIFLRHGNLKCAEEISLIETFFNLHDLEEYNGKLITISKYGVKIR